MKPSNDLSQVWTFSSDSKIYVAEASQLPSGDPIKCPKCRRVISIRHKTGDDYSGDDLAGTHFLHPCGTRILIIND